jgi:thioredoxin 1
MGVKTRTPQKEIENMNALKLNKNNFDSAIKSEKPVLLDFYADWCGPCRMVLPIVEEIAGERDDIVVAKINVDDEPELAERFGVFSIPTLVVMKNGEVVNKSSGARPKDQILALLG